MISYLGLLVQFSPAAGRVGCCGQMSLCMGSTCRIPARQPEVLAASPRVRRAFSLRGEQPGQPEVCAASPQARRTFSLRDELLGQPEAWHPLPGCGAPLVGSQEVFRREPGPVCWVGGGGFSGAEFAPFPSPLPPSSSGDGPALLWSFSAPLFCEPPAVCSGWLIFPSFPTV